MAERFNIGKGWIEVDRNVQSAAFQLGGEEGLAVDTAVAMLLAGERDPAEYGLAPDGDEAGESAGDD